jgi:hypothetical protein
VDYTAGPVRTPWAVVQIYSSKAECEQQEAIHREAFDKVLQDGINARLDAQVARRYLAPAEAMMTGSIQTACFPPGVDPRGRQ